MFAKNTLISAALVAGAFVAAPALAQSDGGAAGVLDHHLASFGSGDVDAIVSDYASDAVILIPGTAFRGHDEIRGLFDALVEEFGQEGVKFELTHRAVEGDIAFITWTAETGKGVYEMATDTFVIDDGKIVAQTVAWKAVNK